MTTPQLIAQLSDGTMIYRVLIPWGGECNITLYPDGRTTCHPHTYRDHCYGRERVRRSLQPQPPRAA